MSMPSTEKTRPMSSTEKAIVFYFRILMGWVFLYAASHQVFVPGWSVTGFLNSTKTFHDFFALFTGPVMGPVTSFLVAYGHLLIGLSLLTGLMVRISAGFGILMMILYWMAHMNWPYISSELNFIVDFHLIYAGVLFYLIVKQAGHVWGLDGWAENLNFTREHPGIRPLFE